jgi:hypothetical protein
MGRVVDGIELVLYPEGDVLAAYGVTDAAQLAWMKPRLVPHPWVCFEQTLCLRNEAAVRRIPQTLVLCSKGVARWREIETAAPSVERVWEIDTGHDLMISEPEATAGMLLRVASL